MKTVLITGGSGMIGGHLTEHLVEKGYSVRHLGRKKHRSNLAEEFLWDLKNGQIEDGALDGANIIVHLAGAGIADKRWTTKRKEELRSSRVETANLLVDTLASGNKHVELFISPSASGYYGAVTSNGTLKENDPPGKDFLARLCQEWEEATDNAQAVSKRVVKLRIGFLLSNRGGALPKMSAPVKFGLGAPLGSGKQWVTWLHIDDLCRMFLFAMENPVDGTFNAVAPHPVANADFMRAMSEVYHRPFFLPAVPAFALKLALGEMANTILEGSRLSPQKIEGAGFKFLYHELNPALENLRDK